MTIRLPSGLYGTRVILTFTSGIEVDEISIIACVPPGTLA